MHVVFLHLNIFEELFLILSNPDLYVDDLFINSISITIYIKN